MLTTAQTQALLADIAQQSRPDSDDNQTFSTVINLFTPWGDRITVYQADNPNRWGFLNSSRTGLMWTPSVSIRAWLDPIIDGASPTSSPSGQR